MTAAHFSEYYKTISNAELLSILENAGNYQPDAVEAAKKEWVKRHLSEAEIMEAKEVLSGIRDDKEKQMRMINEFKSSFLRAGDLLYNTLNPIQTGISGPDKTIRLFVIFFSLFSLYQFYEVYRIRELLFLEFDLKFFLNLLPAALLPVAIFIFWKRKPSGWIMLTIFLTYSDVNILLLLIRSISYRISGGINFPFLPSPAPLFLFIQFILFTGTIFVLCKQSMRDVFFINRNTMQLTIAITAAVSLFIAYFFL